MVLRQVRQRLRGEVVCQRLEVGRILEGEHRQECPAAIQWKIKDMLGLPWFCLCLCVCSENLWGRNWNEKCHFCSVYQFPVWFMCVCVDSLRCLPVVKFQEWVFFIQMSCYKTISPAPFCLISSCINPFFWHWHQWIPTARFSFQLHVCSATVTVFPLCSLTALPITLCFSLWCSLPPDSWPW